MSQQQPTTPGSNPTQAQYSTTGYQQGTSTIDPQYAQPPAKRQRLSPDPQSPQPGYLNGAYRPPQNASATTPSGYGNPFAQSQQVQPQYSPVYSPQYQQSPQSSFNSPDTYSGNRQTWQAQPHMYAQPRPQNAGSPSSSQMMPPPPKPVREEKDEKVGVDDINDALFSSGIDLKAEENYMHNLYNNRHTAQDSFASHPGSFGSSTQGSFTLQGSFSTQPNVSSVGTIGATLTEHDVEQELKHKRTAAARRKAEADQHQLKNPFILGNVLRIKMETIAKEQGVRFNTDGLYVRKAEAKAATNGATGMVVATAESMVEHNAPLADIISLLSLASGERLRGLLDESYGLARARRYADHGRVPIEFKDVAVGLGVRSTEDVVPEGITGTPWDQPEAATDKAQTTVSFQSAVNSELRSLARRDQDAEKARNAKREARRKAQEAAIANGEDVAMDVTLDSTPATAANEAAQPTKMTKKELARQQKEKSTFTDAQAATSTNQTAAMMAMGKKSNRYSWMTGGAASMPTNRFAKATPAPSTPGSGSGTPSRKDARTAAVKKDSENENSTGMSWGEWRENSTGGRGIQVRDWLLVLERDGKEKKAWERTLLHMDTPVEAANSK
ncbi:hypothetical protein AMS68_001753 [Peltaster fructicola]|uniref:Transcription initiation factor TFIID subunit 4 n=1 Tax=Peltaster fructicola TaxID=286661 RepID=A0A6H0XNG2_9PEZI|nr:hypothetical protein AMS68_001753 [Peltaster fructicola]